MIDLQTQHSSMMQVLMLMPTQLWLHTLVGPVAISDWLLLFCSIMFPLAAYQLAHEEVGMV